MSDIDRQWYWDRRSNKAYYPVEVGEDAVRLTSVWHRDEVEGALESEALVPAEEIDVLGHREDASFRLLDSFRLPGDVGADSGESEADEDGNAKSEGGEDGADE